MPKDIAEILGRGLVPRAVAVYGASSRRLESQAARIAYRLVINGHQGRVVLVNPRPQEVHGIATVPSALDTPLAGELDLAIISVPRESVADAVDDCGKAGIRLAIVTSARFAEADEEGARLQDEVVRRALAHGIRLIGPNCMGLVNFTDRLFAAGRELIARPGKISVLAQSGYLSMRMMDYISEFGQGLDLWITMGNCADLGPADLVEYLAERDSTSVVVLYLENLSEPERLRKSILAARAAGIDVVVLKSGRTEVGSQVAASHTGALASPDVFFEVFADETDCIRVDTVREAAQVAGILASVGRPSGPFLVAGTSGGDCVLAGDACAFNGIPLARVSEETLERVHELVPEAATANPIDISPFAWETKRHNDAIAALSEDPDVGCVVLLDAWGWESEDTPDGGRRMEFRALLRDGVPIAPIIADTREPDWARCAMVDAGIAVTSDAETVWRSLGHIVRHLDRRGSLPARSGGRPAPAESGPVPERMLEQDAFQRLHEAGVPMVSMEEVASPEQLLSVCKAFGYPVVLKGLLPGVVHKADRQLVHTDVWGDDEALVTWKSLSDGVAAEQGVVVVQPQIRRALAEVIVSTTDDPVYGLHVMVGGGGAAVEGNSDVAWLRAPINPAAARALLQRTRVGKRLLHKQPHLLEESRLPAVIAGVSQLAADWRESVSEIEINPLIVGSDEIVAVDAVITMRSSTKGTDK